MARIQDLDPNFSVQAEFDPEEFEFYNIESAPFVIEGLLREEKGFCRMPSAVANQVSQGVSELNWKTAGGLARFRSNTKRMVLVTKQHTLTKVPHMPLTGSCGFDLYAIWDAKEEYEGTFVPPKDIENGYTSYLQLYAHYLSDGRKDETRDMILRFPLYSGVKEVLIGLEKGSTLEAPTPRTQNTHIVYYGSSITQGACASRPGNSYESIIDRRLGCTHVNLGFSGNAKGELIMAEYVNQLPMSLFVYDYDHNAPDAVHLEKTHEPFFKRVREAHPTLPIVLMSMPKSRLKPKEVLRREVVERTYRNARAAGDENVYYIDGTTLMTYCGCDGSVELTHPNDWGLASMAKVLGDLLETILTK